jgi:hypothetical protein
MLDLFVIFQARGYMDEASQNVPPASDPTVCPFTGIDGAWTIKEVNGVWEGRSEDGSYIAAETRDAFDREYACVLGCNKRVRELIFEHGSARAAHPIYAAQVEGFATRISAAIEAANVAERDRAKALMEANEQSIDPTAYPPYVSATERFEKSMAEAGSHGSNRDMSEPFHQRVTAELAARAKKEGS